MMRILFMVINLILSISYMPGQTRKVIFDICANDSALYTIYLKEKELGIIDSVVTISRGEFTLPMSVFPFYNISIEGKAWAFKSFL
ncbi:MAG: hypothetical protein KDC53_01435, partial [Saprospiraceae bacterium]|nr:hypothetical protein [Saprospiraceae bacterium]